MISSTSIDPAKLLGAFRAGFDRDGSIDAIAAGLIGEDVVIDGPFGPRPLLYADYVASGRALRQVEDFVMDKVLPYYANTHSQASFCGRYSTRLRDEARKTIARLCGADNRYAVLFAGSGATAGLNRLVPLLGASRGRVLVVIGPYEHHSNILPWRESGAEVVEIGEAPAGGLDSGELRRVLALSPTYDRVICAFSAATNVTGLIADVRAITKIVKDAGALMVWDYAGGGPYLPIDVCPAPGVEIDAIVVSPHKFVGGPGASGILIVRRDAVVTTRPVMPGGGTVTFVSSTGHDYCAALEEREEAGTPDYIGDVRAALAFLVKDAVAPHDMMRRNAELTRRAIEAWRHVDGLEILGPLDGPRLPIFSFLVQDEQGNCVSPQLVPRILSDGFGIQARGGCACAGPYVHRLLDIDPVRSEALRQEILAGNNANKPGFTRLNLSPFMSDTKIAFILDTIAALPRAVARLSGHYRLDPENNVFELREYATAG